MERVFHTSIQVEPIAKNRSNKFGAKANCKYWLEGNPDLKIEVSQHGSTAEIAKQKLINFLTNGGEYETIESNT